MKAAATTVPPGLCRPVPAFQKNFFRVPVFNANGQMTAPLQNKYRFSCGRKTLGDGDAARPRPDDDDVIVVIRPQGA